MAESTSMNVPPWDALKQVTPLVITYNEEPNIGRSLEGLSWAERILVIDSGSTDRTLELLAAVPQVEVVHRPFDSFAAQCNFGISLIRTPWCLSLDADHRITPAFQAELAQLIATAPADLAAVVTPFRYLVAGKPLRGTLLPPRINLMRPGGGHYENDGHSHQFVPSGRTATMREPVLHDDRKPLSRWLASQQRYLQQETQKLYNTPRQQLGLNDALRRTHVIAPFAVLALCLIWHRGLLDGWRGWFYAFQRMYVETLLSLMLWEARRGT
ncbi:glycosyltransferase family 2 protein [Synechococcus sp. EJ6-Ellesmere]|uniref:glycosyltransferase family 2 protein n=1 Tax=Synechococcus sp. EJ6-Ellesmere TaxID=2823734 RepID=UPI0020CD6C23|nr:glycosyltransferase family 2 protein [Synechococcus sp. EJ6-Ellesmere]